MTIILLLIVAVVSLVSIAAPWIGAIAYYFLAIGMPQSIWPWIFQDLRVSLMITAATFLGTIYAAATRKLNFYNFRHVQPWLMLLLCVSVFISNASSTVPILATDRQMPITPDGMVSILIKIFIFYIVALLLINDERKFRYLLLVLLVVTLMQTYWANNVYLSGEFWRFGDNGRLSGPGNGNADENGYAASLVTGAAILYFVAYAVKNKFVKYGLYLALPLLWHAIFLTGSRAGLVALALATLITAFRGRSKVFAVLLMVGLLGALITQGGHLVNRVNSTVEKSASLEQGEKLNPRLESWAVGLQMAQDNPVFGVGVGKFYYVFPYYSDTTPHVAHNTTIQFAAESGLLAGFTYMAMVLLSLFQCARNRKLINRYNLGRWQIAYNETLSASIITITIMMQFLDLMLYEYFYYLMLLTVIHNGLVKKEILALDMGQEEPPLSMREGVSTSTKHLRDSLTGAVIR